MTLNVSVIVWTFAILFMTLTVHWLINSLRQIGDCTLKIFALVVDGFGHPDAKILCFFKNIISIQWIVSLILTNY